MHTRKAVVVHGIDESSATTVLRPFSEEYLNYLYVVCEDAYGEFSSDLVLRTELQTRLGFSDEEFEDMLKQL